MFGLRGFRGLEAMMALQGCVLVLAAVSASLVSTSFNAISAGSVVQGKRATWQLDGVQVFDGGASGVAGSSDATLFETEGLFVP
jgi:hypothetical protein